MFKIVFLSTVFHKRDLVGLKIILFVDFYSQFLFVVLSERGRGMGTIIKDIVISFSHQVRSEKVEVINSIFHEGEIHLMRKMKRAHKALIGEALSNY